MTPQIDPTADLFVPSGSILVFCSQCRPPTQPSSTSGPLSRPSTHYTDSARRLPGFPTASAQQRCSQAGSLSASQPRPLSSKCSDWWRRCQAVSPTRASTVAARGQTNAQQRVGLTPTRFWPNPILIFLCSCRAKYLYCRGCCLLTVSFGWSWFSLRFTHFYCQVAMHSVRTLEHI